MYHVTWAELLFSLFCFHVIKFQLRVSACPVCTSSSPRFLRAVCLFVSMNQPTHIATPTQPRVRASIIRKSQKSAQRKRFFFFFVVVLFFRKGLFVIMLSYMFYELVYFFLNYYLSQLKARGEEARTFCRRSRII